MDINNYLLTAKNKLENKTIKTLILSIYAGIFIAIAGLLSTIVSLTIYNYSISKILSGIVFPIGLILICNFDFYLYTGKICYLPNAIKEKNALNYIFELLLGFIGNFFGAFLIAIIFKLCFFAIS